MWRSKKLDSITDIRYGFSGLSNGNLSFKRSKTGTLLNRKKYFSKFKISIKNLVSMEMVHGTKIAKISGSDKGKGAKSQDTVIANCDGLYTFEPNVVLFGTYADCLPIYIYEPKNRMIALLHEGWRGVTSKITTSLAKTLKRESIQTENCIVVVGPHIQKCCFEVGKEVLDQFPKKYIIENRIDMKGYILTQLLKEGFDKKNIELSNNCTLHSNKYFSHRRKGNLGANCAFIVKV